MYLNPTNLAQIYTLSEQIFILMQNDTITTPTHNIQHAVTLNFHIFPVNRISLFLYFFYQVVLQIFSIFFYFLTHDNFILEEHTDIAFWGKENWCSCERCIVKFQIHQNRTACIHTPEIYVYQVFEPNHMLWYNIEI